MAYDEDLANRLREMLSVETTTEQKMFGGLAFLIGGNMTVAASGQGGMLARVDPAAAEKLLSLDGVEEMSMGGRAAMRGWLKVAESAIASDEALRTWVDRCVAYVKTLPPKR